MEPLRQNPDQLLRVIRGEEKKDGAGHLKIFFGYAAGVGKTYSMLKAAHAAKHRGVDVVAGYIEPHARPRTTSLLNGLEQLDALRVKHNGITLREFDLDAAIERNPELILVDELAHTNAAGCRHTKRCQDVEELLKAGIDVYTTVNVQHIESLNDIVASITGIFVRERVPDSVFDNADQVELIDIEPQDLIDRLSAGNVYKEDQARRATANFFTVEKLTALREIALRRCADRVSLLSENARIKSNADYRTDEHVLACLSSSPSNAKIIRTAAKMAQAFRCPFTALYVETQDDAAKSIEDKERLRMNIRLAQQLGAQIETVYGEDVPLQIADFARLAGVSNIVIGRSAVSSRRFFHKPTLTERLTVLAPNLDVHIIPDGAAVFMKRAGNGRAEKCLVFCAADLLKSILILAAATAAGFGFFKLGFSEANIITLYILGVLVIAVVTKQRIYSLVSSLLSVLIFNFFFTTPRFSLQAYDQGYPITFLTMFLSALLTSTLAVKLKNHARQATETAYRTKLLFDTNQLLQQSDGRDEIIKVTANQLVKLLNRDIAVYLAEEEKLTGPRAFTVSGAPIDPESISPNERAVAVWSFKNNKHAGATTDTLSSAKCLYLAIRVNHRVYGVLGIVIGDTPLSSFENSILLSILGECAMALENEKTMREKEEAAVLAKNEQLRANLLRSISHDLRTPLTSISGNAGILLSSESSMEREKRRQLYTDIYSDSLWLINLVENLLSVTRIEDGTMKLRLSTELLEEIISEALQHTDRRRENHPIRVKSDDSFILVKVDARLIVQVILNLVDNAVKYTPDGSEIVIEAKREGAQAVIAVGDNGPGVPDEAKKHIFDMFYTAETKIADSRRSLGLGLALCKSIVTAHGGAIWLTDNRPHGAVFTFTLPTEEVTLHE